MISYIFWIDFLLYSYLGSIIIYVFNELPFNTVINSIIGGEKTRFIVWSSISYTMIAFPLGMIFSNFVFKFRNQEILEYNLLPITNFISKRDSYVKFPLYLLSILCIFVVVHVFLSLGTIPIIKAFTLNNEIEVLQLRANIDSNFPGNVYLKNIFGLSILPILSYISFGYYLKTKSTADLIWYLLLLIFTSLILTYNVAKAPLVRYFLGYVFFIVYFKGEIPKTKLLKYFILIFFFLILSFVFLGKKGGIVELLFSYNSGISGRLLISQVSSLYKHFELFPDIYPHIGFGSVSDLFALGESSKRSARLVLENVNPSWVQNEMGGVFNTLFIGEAYANFGLVGVITMPIYVGFIIKSFHSILLRLPKTPLFLGILVFFSYKSNLTGGVNEYIYNPIIFSLMVVFISLVVFSKFLFYTTPQKYRISTK